MAQDRQCPVDFAAQCGSHLDATAPRGVVQHVKYARPLTTTNMTSAVANTTAVAGRRLLAVVPTGGGGGGGGGGDGGGGGLQLPAVLISNAGAAGMQGSEYVYDEITCSGRMEARRLRALLSSQLSLSRPSHASIYTPLLFTHPS